MLKRSRCHGIPCSFGTRRDELRRSWLAPLILWLYRVLGCQRRWRPGRVLLHAALRLEGGGVYSATARTIMREFHGVEIGAYSYGPCFDPAVVPEGVTIGRYTSIGPGARFFPRNHPLDRVSTHPFFYDRRLGLVESDLLEDGTQHVGNDVWVGCNATVLPGCRRIGDGAVIGAGAVVTRDVPDYAIVAGVPAKVLQHRFSEELTSRLRASHWWTGSIAELAEHLPDFLAEATTLPLAHPLFGDLPTKRHEPLSSSPVRSSQ